MHQGRVRKGKEIRIGISILMDQGTLLDIEDYVYERNATDRKYSRSDFFNEAAIAKLTAHKLAKEQNTLTESSNSTSSSVNTGNS